MNNTVATPSTVQITSVVTEDINYPISVNGSYQAEPAPRGSADISRVIISGHLVGTYTYELYDVYGVKNNFDDPIEIEQGGSLVTGVATSDLNLTTGQHEVVINRTVVCNALADGSMHISLTLVSLDPFNEITYTVTITNPIPPADPADADFDEDGYATSVGSDAAVSSERADKLISEILGTSKSEIVESTVDGNGNQGGVSSAAASTTDGYDQDGYADSVGSGNGAEGRDTSLDPIYSSAATPVSNIDLDAMRLNWIQNRDAEISTLILVELQSRINSLKAVLQGIIDGTGDTGDPTGVLVVWLPQDIDVYEAEILRRQSRGQLTDLLGVAVSVAGSSKEDANRAVGQGGVTGGFVPGTQGLADRVNSPRHPGEFSTGIGSFTQRVNALNSAAIAAKTAVDDTFTKIQSTQSAIADWLDTGVNSEGSIRLLSAAAAAATDAATKTQVSAGLGAITTGNRRWYITSRTGTASEAASSTLQIINQIHELFHTLFPTLIQETPSINIESVTFEPTTSKNVTVTIDNFKNAHHWHLKIDQDPEIMVRAYDNSGQLCKFIGPRGWKEDALHIVGSNPATTATVQQINSTIIEALPPDGNMLPLMDITGTSKGAPNWPNTGYRKAINLISPIHFITCKHWAGMSKNGTIVQFVDYDGNTVTRTIVDQIGISYHDTTVGILNAPVENVAIYPLPDTSPEAGGISVPGWPDTTAINLDGAIVVAISQYREALLRIAQIAYNKNPVSPSNPFPAVRNQNLEATDWFRPNKISAKMKYYARDYNPIVVPEALPNLIPTGSWGWGNNGNDQVMGKGSSGGPLLIYAGNETPILIETHTTHPPEGPYYGNSKMQVRIQDAMNDLSTRNAATSYTLLKANVTDIRPSATLDALHYVASEPTSCDSSSRTVKLTVMGGGLHTATAIAVDVNHGHLKASNKYTFSIPVDQAPGAVQLALEKERRDAAVANATQKLVKAIESRDIDQLYVAIIMSGHFGRRSPPVVIPERAVAQTLMTELQKEAEEEVERVRLAGDAVTALQVAMDAEDIENLRSAIQQAVLYHIDTTAAEALLLDLQAAADRRAAATVNIIDDVSSLFTETGTYVDTGGVCGVCVATGPTTGLSIATGGTTTYCSTDSNGSVSRGTVVGQTYTSVGTAGGTCATTVDGVIQISKGMTCSTGSIVTTTNGSVIVRDNSSKVTTFGGTQTGNKIVGGTTVVNGGTVGTYLGQTEIKGGTVTTLVKRPPDIDDWTRLEVVTGSKVTESVTGSKVTESVTGSKVTGSTDCPLPKIWVDGECVCPPGMQEDQYGYCYEVDDGPCDEGWVPNSMGECVRLSTIYKTWPVTELIPGCTDPAATNYDDTAEIDDGSCYYDDDPVSGCTDPNATNYNEFATIDDGSCYYDDPVPGCMDDGKNAPRFMEGGANDEGRPPGYVGAASNYNRAATVHEGPCYYYIPGCTDDGKQPAGTFPRRPPGYVGEAINYNPTANQDDGSCRYTATNIPGCMDDGTGRKVPAKFPGTSALNFDRTATIHDNSCNYPSGPHCPDCPVVITGCMDDGTGREVPAEIPGTSALNYNPHATVHVPVCEYPLPEVLGCMDPNSPNYNPAATIDDNSCDAPCVLIERTDENAITIIFAGDDDDADANAEDVSYDEDGYATENNLDKPIIPVYPPPEEIVAPEEISCDEEECNKDDLTY